MALDSSPDRPQPLRTLVNGTADWVGRLGFLWVEAEVVSYRDTTSARQFLTLKDTSAEISADISCARPVLDAVGIIRSGTKVVARLRPTVYRTTGRLSFECVEMQVAGEGRLIVQIERLRGKLQAEGLFAPHLKKKLPFLPKAIGLITGENSAAERDVVVNTRNRWPGVEFLIEYARMQGTDTAAEVMTKLTKLDRDPRVEVIVIARGGGSFEDLLPFNDEGMVRAIAACQTPVVAAIGHDVDNPIINNVADLAASTPTDAAKRIVPDAQAEQESLSRADERLGRAIDRRIDDLNRDLKNLRSRPVLRNPLGAFEGYFDQLEHLRHRLNRAIDDNLYRESTSLTHALARIRGMSPKSTLERGYAILVDGDGAGITSVSDVEEGDHIMAYVADGTLTLEVGDIEAAARSGERNHS